MNFNPKVVIKFNGISFIAPLDNVEIIRYLTENGANVSSETYDGWTPLHFASANENTDVVHYLVEHGANVNAENNKKSTPLNQAINKGK